jgi:hypothetical protein
MNGVEHYRCLCLRVKKDLCGKQAKFLKAQRRSMKLVPVGGSGRGLRGVS